MSSLVIPGARFCGRVRYRISAPLGQGRCCHYFPPTPSSTPLLALATVLLPLLLLTNAPTALAQPAPIEVAAPSACPPSASRARERCEPEATVVTLEQELTFSIEVPALAIVQCAAAIEITYSQRDTVVRVVGTLDHEDCAASSGEYAVTVRIRDEGREVKTLEFTERWQRADDEPVRLSADYPIGANVDLVAVRVQQSRCTCADEP